MTAVDIPLQLGEGAPLFSIDSSVDGPVPGSCPQSGPFTLYNISSFEKRPPFATRPKMVMTLLSSSLGSY